MPFDKQLGTQSSHLFSGNHNTVSAGLIRMPPGLNEREVESKLMLVVLSSSQVHDQGPQGTPVTFSESLTFPSSFLFFGECCSVTMTNSSVYNIHHNRT